MPMNFNRPDPSTAPAPVAQAPARDILEVQPYDISQDRNQLMTQLEGSPEITKKHLSEAISYRQLDRRYFGG